MSSMGGYSRSMRPTAEEKKQFTPVVQGYLKEKLGKEPALVKILLVKSQVMADDKFWILQLHKALPVYGNALTAVGHKAVPLDF